MAVDVRRAKRSHRQRVVGKGGGGDTLTGRVHDDHRPRQDKAHDEHDEIVGDVTGHRPRDSDEDRAAAGSREIRPGAATKIAQAIAATRTIVIADSASTATSETPNTRADHASPTAWCSFSTAKARANEMKAGRFTAISEVTRPGPFGNTAIHAVARSASAGGDLCSHPPEGRSRCGWCLPCRPLSLFPPAPMNRPSPSAPLPTTQRMTTTTATSPP